MGRYEGEDYEERGFCKDGCNPAPNGTCWVCRNTVTPDTKRGTEAVR